MLQFSSDNFFSSRDTEARMLRLYHVARLHTMKVEFVFRAPRSAPFVLCERLPTRHTMLLYVHRGCFEITIDGIKHYAGKYDAFYVKPGHNVEVTSREQRDAEISITEFDCTPCLELPCTKDGVFMAHRAAILEDMIEKIELFEMQGRCYAEAMLLPLLEAMAHYTDHDQSADVYLRLLAYLRSHMNEDCSPAKLSEIFGRHGGNLNAVVKRYSGQSLTALLNRERIRAICNYLGATDFPLEKIAALTFFRSAQQMSQFFKYHTGISPSRYRALYT